MTYESVSTWGLRQFSRELLTCVSTMLCMVSTTQWTGRFFPGTEKKRTGRVIPFSMILRFTLRLIYFSSSSTSLLSIKAVILFFFFNSLAFTRHSRKRKLENTMPCGIQSSRFPDNTLGVSRQWVRIRIWIRRGSRWFVERWRSPGREKSLTLVLSICRSTRLSRDNKSPGDGTIAAILV